MEGREGREGGREAGREGAREGGREGKEEGMDGGVEGGRALDTLILQMENRSTVSQPFTCVNLCFICTSLLYSTVSISM